MSFVNVFHLITLTVLLSFPESTKTSASSEVAQRPLQQEPYTQHDRAPQFTPYFESPEHAIIGDQVVLRYLDTNISGSDFNYTVKATNLSFGYVIALAGDFYAAWQYTACAPSISDDWPDSSNTSFKIAELNVDMLRTDSGNKLSCILPLIKSQSSKVLEARRNGSDVAQAFHDLEYSYNLSYEWCTAGYAIIALCNPDHFGHDAAIAYSAVHVLALGKAREAHQTQNESILKEAYFIDGYAQHFLTDCFSAGHVRTPRRILHSTSLDLKLMPGDQCSKQQHDEDNASGLWVTNEEGYSWAAYGDKFLLQGRSARNLYMLDEATQASVNEVWDTFVSGNVPNVSEFAARRKVPLPSSAVGITNFVPLFETKLGDNSTMFFRQDIDQRASSDDRENISTTQDNTGWQNMLNKFEASSSFKSLYTFTKSFVSQQEILQISAIDPDSSKVVMNKFGLVDAGPYGHNWGMNYQGVMDIPQANANINWTDARVLEGNVYALVGERRGADMESYAVHLGFQLSQTSTGHLTLQPFWSEVINYGNALLTPGQVIYGRFDREDDANVMIKHFQRHESKTHATIEVWSLSLDWIEPPSLLRSLAHSDVNFLLPHKIDSSDTFSCIVSYGTGSSDSYSTGTWSFTHWESEYTKLKQWTFSESSVRRPQVILSDPHSNHLIRIFYGGLDSETPTIQIDLIRPRWDKDDSSLIFDEPVTQHYPVTWHGSLEEDYLTWFVSDVDNDGHPDLVTYTTNQTNTGISVVVFPGQPNQTYGYPVISNITLDPNIGTDLVSPSLHPIFTTQSTYLYPSPSSPDTQNDQSSTSSAILSFFDNNGILGTRIVAPIEPGSLEYELKGQDPAIAGQRSTTLGTRPGDWMGLKRRASAVGIVVLQ